MVFQNYALYPHMNVYDNMAFSLKLAGESREDTRVRVEEAALILGLQEYLKALPAPALGRPASARGDGARDRPQAAGIPVRRAAVQISTPGCAWPCAPRSRALHQRLEDHVGLRHPRPDRGHDHGDKIVVMNGGRGRANRLAARSLRTNPANQFVAGFIGSAGDEFPLRTHGEKRSGARGRGRRRSAPADAGARGDRQGREVVVRRAGPSTSRWRTTAFPPRSWSSSPPARTRRSSASSRARTSRRSCASATTFRRVRRSD